MSDAVDAEIALIRDALTARMGEITRSVVASIRQQIPFYADAGAVSEEMVTAAVHDNLSYMVRALTDTTFDTAPAAATGRTRAEIGVPLAAVMHAYRIGVHRVWQEVHAIAEARPELSRQALLSATQHMWEAQDQFVDAMAGAHRDRTTEQALDDAAERAALAEYLLQGRIPSDQSLWEIATILRIPTTGPYLAVAAATVDLARGVLHGLYELPDDDREPLFATFRAWVAHDGNVKDAAAELFVHPNTVRHRLRRVEQLTGRSVGSPREVAELCLAFEVDARVRFQVGASRDATA